MIYDPKKPIKPPPPAKDSPRVRDGFSVQGKATTAGKCSGCRDPYGYSDEIVQFTPAGKLEPTEAWHPQCWKAANRDFLDSLRDGPREWPFK